MAGTRFQKHEFIERTKARYGVLIAEQQAIVDVEKGTSDAELLADWRDRETRRVLMFAQRLRAGEVQDHELANFETKRVPDVGRVNWSSESFAARQVKQLARDLEKILVYASSLAEIEPGVIEVSAADLKRIGYGL